MSLKNVTRAVFGARIAKFLEILMDLKNWLGGRDSLPLTMSGDEQSESTANRGVTESASQTTNEAEGRMKLAGRQGFEPR